LSYKFRPSKERVIELYALALGNVFSGSDLGRCILGCVSAKNDNRHVGGLDSTPDCACQDHKKQSEYKLTLLDTLKAFKGSRH
jgi:hypothetical protein